MSMFLTALCVIGTLYSAICLYYLLFNRSYRYERSVKISRSPEEVFSYVSNLRNWEHKYPNTLFAAYDKPEAPVQVGLQAIEKYWGITGYHVFKHEVIEYEPPRRIFWRGRTIYGGFLVLLFLPGFQHIRGTFGYSIEDRDGGCKWTRQCQFQLYSMNPIYRLCYIFYMPLFRAELLKALGLYQTEVKALMEDMENEK